MRSHAANVYETLSGKALLLKSFSRSCKLLIAMENDPPGCSVPGIGLNYDVRAGVMKLHLATNIEDTMRRFQKFVPKRMFPTKTPLPTGGSKS